MSVMSVMSVVFYCHAFSFHLPSLCTNTTTYKKKTSSNRDRGGKVFGDSAKPPTSPTSPTLAAAIFVPWRPKNVCRA
jgi:hypothetical protein